jgi:predicted RecA/RadA family phage recombinase
MPTATYVHHGDAVDYTPGSDIANGAVVVQGELVGVTRHAATAGEVTSVAVTGVFDLPKATGGGSAIAAGADVYWDDAEQVAKTDDETGSNKKLGRTVAAAADADATVRVRLSQ